MKFILVSLMFLMSFNLKAESPDFVSGDLGLVLSIDGKPADYYLHWTFFCDNPKLKKEVSYHKGCFIRDEAFSCKGSLGVSTHTYDESNGLKVIGGWVSNDVSASSAPTL